MAQVVIEINGRSYTMECGEGQEEHLHRLARQVDGELARLRDMAGPVGEIRLLIMTALVMADRVAELEARLAELEKLQKETAPHSERIVQALQQASDRLERLALLNAEKSAA